MTEENTKVSVPALDWERAEEEFAPGFDPDSHVGAAVPFFEREGRKLWVAWCYHAESYPTGERIASATVWIYGTPHTVSDVVEEGDLDHMNRCAEYVVSIALEKARALEADGAAW